LLDIIYLVINHILYKKLSFSSASSLPGASNYSYFPSSLSLQDGLHSAPALQTDKSTDHEQGRNEWGQEGHNSPGAESLRGRRITAEGAEKSQHCHKYFIQYSSFASERP